MITNFGGNLHFTPQHVYTPKTEAEVLAILNQHAHGKIRVVGALHSWSPAVVCEDAIVDLRHFDGIAIERDADGTVWATIGGGSRIKDALRKLNAQNVTLPTIGLITEQTIAGAISTATHGSGRSSFSHFIDSARVACYNSNGAPRVADFSSGNERRAIRCALGCVGVILSVRIRCVPRFDIAETIVRCAALDDVLAEEGRFPLQQFYLVPHLWSYFVQRRIATPEPRRKRTLGARLYRGWWFLFIDLGLHVVIKLLVSVLKSPGLTRFFFRHILAKTILTNTAVIDESERMLVMEHELFKHLEIEIFVPASQVRSAAALVRVVVERFAGTGGRLPKEMLDALQSIGMDTELADKRGTFTHHYPITFRRVLPDDTLISMTADAAEPWYAISFITYREPRDAFFVFADFLARSMTKLFGARLHWGKHFPLGQETVAASYPHLGEFRDVCRQVDPNGVFRNKFMNRIVFGESQV